MINLTFFEQTHGIVESHGMTGLLCCNRNKDEVGTWRPEHTRLACTDSCGSKKTTAQSYGVHINPPTRLGKSRLISCQVLNSEQTRDFTFILCHLLQLCNHCALLKTRLKLQTSSSPCYPDDAEVIIFRQDSMQSSSGFGQ